MDSRPKAAVIGLDGATFDLILPMVEAGKLPNLARLLQEGSHGPLTSCIPPISAPAWVTFQTGKEPSRHGVMGFFHFSPRDFIQGRFPLVTAASNRAQTLWDVLTAQQRRTIAINVPLTYPPRPLDGILITGLGTPENAVDFLHPRGLAGEIERETGTSCRIVDPFTPRVASKAAQRQLLREQLELEGRRADLAAHLMGRYPWDLLVVVFTVSDRLQHFLWDDRASVESMYAELDRHVGRLVSRLPPDTFVAVLSDHGFGPQLGNFNTNAWLRERGYLKLKRPTLQTLFSLYRWSVARKPLQQVLARAGAGFLLPLLPRRLREIQVTIPYPKRKEMEWIDWAATRAYGAAYGICINRRGREPHGTVEENQHQDICEQILRDLREIRHPDTGQPLVTFAARREEVYRGPCIQEAPDILFMVQDLAYIQSNRVHARRLLGPTFLTGNHRMDGIWMCRGPGVKAGGRVQGARLVDAMPTILHALGLAIPDDLDGRVLDSCFESGWLQRHPPRFQSAQTSASASHRYGQDEDDEIRRRLQDLGYLE